MAINSQVRKFAQVALNVALELDAAGPFVERFNSLAGFYRANRVFRQLLITTQVTPDRKVAALQQAFGAKLTGLEYEVLRMLLEQRLGRDLPAIVKALNLLARTTEIGAQLTVYTPQPVTADELMSMSQGLEKVLGRGVRATAITDPALLGGLKLRLDNLLVDGSLQSRLARVRQELL